MRNLILELIPHAPKQGLYVTPDIPVEKLRNAIGDYARSVREEDVLALYDATLLGTGKDGAVFTAESLVFQNHDLEPVQEVRYEDIVQVETKRKLLGGRQVVLTVNRGRATFALTLDFSGRAGAAPYVARFLNEALHRTPSLEEREPERVTNRAAVQRALSDLHERNQLSTDDLERLLRTLNSGAK